MRNEKSGYDLQSMLSMAGKLSCKSTALKRCTNIEILWYRKLVSLLLPRSLRRSNVIKIDPYNFELHRFRVDAFLRHSVHWCEHTVMMWLWFLGRILNNMPNRTKENQ